jgi:arylsulfatase A-like enzyme
LHALICEGAACRGLVSTPSFVSPEEETMRALAVLLFLTCSLVSVPAWAESSLEGSAPNVILMITDDQGYGPVGRHGHPWIQTPCLDELYDSSLRFTRFLVSPTCAPTRSALMTGRHPMRNGVTHTILERERMTLDATILPQVLKARGYTSGIFGKWHLGDEQPYQPDQRGFDEAFIHGAGGIGQAYACSCADAPNNKYFDPVIRHNGSFVRTKGFCTDIFFTAAMGWIQQVKDRDEPFFAYITTNAPHGPFIAPPKNVKRFTDLGFGETQAGFYGMIENIDENVGRLLRQLEDWQLMEDTLIIFMSDNGMTGGGSGRGVMGHLPDGTPMSPYNAGMKGLKGSADEGGVRVPFFVRWDGRIQPGRDVDRIAAHIDVLPTLAALADAELPEGQVEGRSLLPLIEDPQTKWPDRYLFTHRGRWKTGEEPNLHQWKGFAVRNQRYRFVDNQALYDMQEDPGQTTNVIDQHPDLVDQMRGVYDAWWKQTRPMMVNESAPMSPIRPFHEWYHQQEQTTGIPDWKPPQL